HAETLRSRCKDTASRNQSSQCRSLDRCPRAREDRERLRPSDNPSDIPDPCSVSRLKATTHVEFGCSIGLLAARYEYRAATNAIGRALCGRQANNSHSGYTDPCP